MNKYSFGHDPEATRQDADLDAADFTEAANEYTRQAKAELRQAARDKLQQNRAAAIIAADQAEQVRKTTAATAAAMAEAADIDPESLEAAAAMWDELAPEREAAAWAAESVAYGSTDPRTRDRNHGALALAILDDDYGISAAAYKLLIALPGARPLAPFVDATDGRFYIIKSNVAEAAAAVVRQ